MQTAWPHPRKIIFLIVIVSILAFLTLYIGRSIEIYNVFQDSQIETNYHLAYPYSWGSSSDEKHLTDSINSSLSVSLTSYQNRTCQLPLFLIPSTGSKTLLIIIVINQIEFIALNYASALLFLPNNSFEYVVFDHSLRSRLKIAHAIKQQCDKLQVKYVRIPYAIQNRSPSNSHGSAVAWIIRKYASKHKGRVWFLDVDMFFINDWVWEDILPATKYDIMTIWQRRPYKQEPGPYIFYLWPNFIIFQDIERIPNLDHMRWGTTRVANIVLDTGGETYHWIKAHPQIRIKGIWNTPYAIDSDVTGYQEQYRRQTPEMILRIHQNPDLYELIWPSDANIGKLYDHAIIGDFLILHYRAGSNWNLVSNEFATKKWVRILGAVQKAMIDKEKRNEEELYRYNNCLQALKSKSN